MYIVKMFMVPYIITIVVELIAALLWQIRAKKELLAVLWINTITNPLVTAIRWMSNQHIPNADIRLFLLIAAEIAVLLCEWLLFKRFIKSKGYPFLLSFSLNAASFAAGYLSPFIFMGLQKLHI